LEVPEYKGHDKYYQQFMLCLKTREAREYVKSLRQDKKLRMNFIRESFAGYRKFLKLQRESYKKMIEYLKKKGIGSRYEQPSEWQKAERKFGHTKVAKKLNDLQNKLQKYVDGRIKMSDVKRMMKIFGMPFSWEYALRYYILTDKFLSPSVRAWVSLHKDYVMVAVSAEATNKDLMKAFKKVEHYQCFLHGYEIKDKRTKKKLHEHMNIAKDYELYRDSNLPSVEVKDFPTGEVQLVNKKKEMRDQLICKYKPESQSVKADEKEAKRHRKIYQN
ncbi:hypothetical protein ACFL2G_05335, partial [Candidatus Omnitrophota bacterium]